MIFDLPPTNGRETVRNQGRLPAAVDDARRQSEIVAKIPAAGYAGVMNQTEADKTPAPAAMTAPAKTSREFLFWEKEAFGFGDFLDIINPLHHIPIVATVYRNLSADKIGFMPRVIGGALWGRVGGFVAGLVNAAVEWFTGKDVGDHIFAAIWGEKKLDNESLTARSDVGQVVAPKATSPAQVEIRPAPEELTRDPLPAPAFQAHDRVENDLPDLEFEPVAPMVTAPAEFFLQHLHDAHYRRGQTRFNESATPATLRLIA